MEAAGYENGQPASGARNKLILRSVAKAGERAGPSSVESLVVSVDRCWWGRVGGGRGEAWRIGGGGGGLRRAAGPGETR